MFVFDRARWQKDKAHFLRTYQTVCPVARRLGNDEMLSHQFLTADHAVQQTRWSSGTCITVNFGEHSRTCLATDNPYRRSAHALRELAAH